MIGRLTSLPVTSTMEVDGRQYKYSAELEFKVEVTLHPRPKGRPEMPINVTSPEPEDRRLIVPSGGDNNWEKIIVTVAWTIVGTAMIWLGYKQIPMTSRTTSIMPFKHTIDLNNPHRKRHFNQNA